jgi:predicted transcriptional regulator
MSPRAACRLETLGYEIYDYAPGKVDWMAHALPVEGTGAMRVTALSLARDDVTTCALKDPLDDVARRIDASPYGFALVISASRIVLGRVRRSSISNAESQAAAEALMEPGPSTIRPHTALEDLGNGLSRSAVNTLIVTDPEGKLLGVVRRADVQDVS